MRFSEISGYNQIGQLTQESLHRLQRSQSQKPYLVEIEWADYLLGGTVKYTRHRYMDPFWDLPAEGLTQEHLADVMIALLPEGNLYQAITATGHEELKALGRPIYLGKAEETEA